MDQKQKQETTQNTLDSDGQMIGTPRIPRSDAQWVILALCPEFTPPLGDDTVDSTAVRAS